MVTIPYPGFRSTGCFDEGVKLVHYTSATGLHGILSDGCLWATHFKFLNDKEEFAASKRSLEALATKLAEQKLRAPSESEISPESLIGAKEDALRRLAFLYERSTDVFSAYVFSAFCVQEASGIEYTDGILQHWAYYARDGGYALQLDPKRLEKLYELEREKYKVDHAQPAKVIYSRGEDVPPLMEERYGEVCQYITDIDEIKKLDKTKQQEFTAGCAASLLRCLSQVKDAYFEIEKEARIVYFVSNLENERLDRHEIFLRPSPNFHVPYIKLFHGLLLGPDSPIERIVVGPHPESQARKLALDVFLKSKGLSIATSVSGVPFVGR